MYPYKKINYVLLEETLNTLLADEEIKQRRYGQVNMVKEKLRERVQSSLDALGFPVETQSLYLDGEAEAAGILAGILPGLLSQRKLRSFLLQQSSARPAALAYLKECMLDKAQIAFRKETGLSAKVWLGFYNSTAATSPETLEIIRRGLKLTNEECRRFDAMAIPEFFPVNDPLKREVHVRRRETGMAILEFLDFAYVSKDAWEAFYPIPPEGDDPPAQEKGIPDIRSTSQDTLLKLIIGFGIPEADARALLGLAGSDFTLLRDLVFLAAMRTQYGHPDYLPEILDFFAEDEEGKTRYANPYARIF